jgi:hypothetical protein
MFCHHESKYADPGGVGLRPLACWDRVYDYRRVINKGLVFYVTLIAQFLIFISLTNKCTKDNTIKHKS